LIACAALAPATEGAERAGDIAVGFNTSDTPLGFRYFFSDRIAADLGLGFDAIDADFWASSLFLEGGATVVLFDADAAFFFVRPAGGYQSRDDRLFGKRYGSLGEDDAQWSVFYVKVNLGAEVRLAQRFGLTFQYGVEYRYVSVPDHERIRAWVGTDAITEYRSFGENVTEAGVWFTF